MGVLTVLRRIASKAKNKTMTKTLGGIAARLASERGELVPVEDKGGAVPHRPRARKKVPAPTEHIEEILLHLLNHEESGTVRIAAAKVLLDRVNANSKEDNDAKRREQDERAAALSDAQSILAEFAAARTASLSIPAALDTNSTGGTVDTATMD